MWWWSMLFSLRRRAVEARRLRRSGVYALLTAASGLLAGLALAVLALFLVTMVLVGAWWLALLGALVTTVVMAWPLAQAIAIPMGWPRVAAALTRVSTHFGTNRRGGALIAAAWAINRQRTPRPDDLAWVEARRDQTGRLGDCEVVAGALLAAARGDRDGARALLDSLTLLPEHTPAARELAAEWLAADDAERGDWRRIVARSRRRAHGKLEVDPLELGLPDEIERLRRVAEPPSLLWPATPTTFFLEGVALRLVGDPAAPGDVALLIRWLEAPRRWRTFRLWQRAMTDYPVVRAAPPPDRDAAVATTAATTTAATAAAATPAAPDLLGEALGRHVAALAAQARGTLRRHHVAAAARAWDRAMTCDDARTAVLTRALDVGAPPGAGHQVLDEVSRAAADDLADLVIAAELPLAELGGDAAASPLLATVIQRVRHRLLADLELAVSRTALRARAGRALPGLDEWREILAIRAGHARACRIGGAALRQLAFPHLHAELTAWGVGLWNDRHEHVLSDAITYWLLAEALAVGDAQAIETHARNASLPIPSR